MVKEKRCPKCSRVYFDETLNYCLADGSFLYFPEELAENAGGAETEFLNVSAETEEVFVKPTEAPTEVLTVPTDALRSVETRIIPKTEPSFDPAPVAPLFQTQAGTGWNYGLIGACAVGFLILIGAIYFAQTMLRGENSPANRKATANSSPISNSKPANILTATPTASPSAMPPNVLFGTTWTGKSRKDTYKITFWQLGIFDYSENGGESVRSMSNHFNIFGDDTVIITFSGGLTKWSGTLKGDQIVFDCSNQDGEQWKTTATRVK